uniref:Uncharacterized protein n=1 Tax=Clytia hemisphaerica TaxID=252671 RepID=A0A7M5XKM8_9CNID
MLYSIDLIVKNICQPEISDNSFSIDFFVENVNQSAQADKVYIFAVYEISDNSFSIDFFVESVNNQSAQQADKVCFIDLFVENVNQSAQADKVYIFAVYLFSDQALLFTHTVGDQCFLNHQHTVWHF